jgi:hypothetical protein
MRQFACLILLLFVGSSAGQTGRSAAGMGDPDSHRRLPEFSYTNGWLGSDVAYSIPLTATESLWVFGDTFVGARQSKLRSEYKTMVRNAVGISKCQPGKDCSMRYFWKNPTSAKPRSFFDTGTDELWYWPLDGFLGGKTLYLSLLAVRNKPGAPSELANGFEIVGTKLAVIDDVRGTPESWHVAIQDLTDSRLWPGVSMVPEGKYVIWYTQISTGEARGFMTVMRVPQDKMATPSGNWEYLDKNNQWVRGLAGSDAMHVIEQPISEMSVRYHPSIKKWLALSTGPEFPSDGAVVRLADFPVGPWSNPRTIYAFPEMNRDNPEYDKDTFCYAVKEHTEFAESKVALTYACNSMIVAKAIVSMNIYRPRVVILNLPK